MFNCILINNDQSVIMHIWSYLHISKGRAFGCTGFFDGTCELWPKFACRLLFSSYLLLYLATPLKFFLWWQPHRWLLRPLLAFICILTSKALVEHVFTVSAGCCHGCYSRLIKKQDNWSCAPHMRLVISDQSLTLIQAILNTLHCLLCPPSPFSHSPYTTLHWTIGALGLPTSFTLP